MDPRAVSIATSFDYGDPLDVQVPLIVEAGFTYCSLGANATHSDYLATTGRAHIRGLTERHGISIDTIHGPRLDGSDSLAMVSRAVTAAGELGVPVVVVHGSPVDFPEVDLPERLHELFHACPGLAPLLA